VDITVSVVAGTAVGALAGAVSAALIMVRTFRLLASRTTEIRTEFVSEIRAVAQQERGTSAAVDRLTQAVAAAAGQSQAWFWTPEWQAGEKRADEELEAGGGVVYYDEESFLGALEAGANDTPAVR
jgi:uncharacterized iron-regulated membrane protein